MTTMLLPISRATSPIASIGWRATRCLRDSGMLAALNTRARDFLARPSAAASSSCGGVGEREIGDHRADRQGIERVDGVKRAAQRASHRRPVAQVLPIEPDRLPVGVARIDGRENPRPDVRLPRFDEQHRCRREPQQLEVRESQQPR